MKNYIDFHHFIHYEQNHIQNSVKQTQSCYTKHLSLVNIKKTGNTHFKIFAVPKEGRDVPKIGCFSALILIECSGTMN